VVASQVRLNAVCGDAVSEVGERKVSTTLVGRERFGHDAVFQVSRMLPRTSSELESSIERQGEHQCGASTMWRPKLHVSRWEI